MNNNKELWVYVKWTKYSYVCTIGEKYRKTVYEVKRTQNTKTAQHFDIKFKLSTSNTTYML